MAEISLDSVLHIAEIVSLVGGVVVTVYKLGRIAERVENGLTAQQADIVELKTTVKGLGETLTQVALQRQRLDTHDQRLDMMMKYIDEIRRGEGFIVPPVAPRQGR